MDIKIIKKPWGEEIWFAQNEHYAGKILKVTKGHRISLQYHEKKQETQYLYKGSVKMIFGDDVENLQERVLKVGEKFDINPPMIHRVHALEDSEIFEVSTPELDDVVKLQDDYGRSGKGNNFNGDAALHAQNFNQNQTI